MRVLRQIILSLVLLVGVAVLRPSATLLAAPESDNNLQWDWLYHAPNAGNPLTETVPGQTDKFLNINGTNVTIYALTDQNDATMARVRLWEGSERFVSMSKVGTATWNGRTVDVWRANIANAITSGPTYYYIHVQDGTHNAYLKKNNGGQTGGYTNPHGQFIRNTLVTDGDYSYTATAGPVNTVSAPAVAANQGASGSFVVTLTNNQAITGGNIVLQYDATRGVTLSGHPVSGSGAATVLTIPVGSVAANAGATYTVNYTVAGNATTGSFALDITNATALTGSTNTVLQDGAFNVIDPNGVREVYVQLFEWRWNDVALECPYLAQKGYKGVQISPPNEHILPPATQSHAWWARYQPVSYSLNQSRSGTSAEFQAMLDACNAVGVDIVADMVINHMANWADSGVGTAGNSYSAVTLSYPGVPYTIANFHQNGDGTGAFGNCRIQPGDYTSNAWRVRNCSLENMPDLKTEEAATRQIIANYMNTLLGMGVKGFRIDGAKHMLPEDLTAIRALLTDPSVFIFAEVIDNGGEPITSAQYTGIGYVTEFKYQTAMGNSFTQAGGCPGPNLSWLSGIASGKLPSANALIFTNNHDSQRGHGAAGPCVVDYRDGDGVYNLAQAFMLAHPYGRPVVMSSYHWDGVDDNAGPPTVNGAAGTSGATKPVYGAGQSAGDTPQFCDSVNWVCEHRRAPIANMVAFRNVAFGEPVTNWWDNGGNRIAFGRNGKGFATFNRDGSAHTRTYATGMPAGEYCDVIRGQLNAAGTGCTGPVIVVDGSGNIANLTVNGMDAVAIHIGQRIQSNPAPTVTINAPANGSTQSGVFTAQATAEVVGSTITQVAFQVNNVTVSTDTAAPYEATIDAAVYGAGTHTLRAVAMAANGQTGQHTITFVVPSANQLTVSVGDYSVAAGGTFQAAIVVANNAAPGIGALNVELSYNPAVLSAVACAVDPDNRFNAETCNLTFAPNTVKMNFVATAGATGNLTLARVTFQAVGAAGSNSPLTLATPTAANPAGATIAVTRVNGSAAVTSGVALGDVNCDGAFTTIDALFVAQYDVGLRAAHSSCPLPSNTLYLPACDVSGDGQCNVVDQLFMLQCDIGIANAFCPTTQTHPNRQGKLGNGNTTTAAANSATVALTIGDHPVAPGGSVTVPVQASVAAGQNLGAVNVTLTYDGGRFAVASCVGAPGMDSALCNTSVPGQLRLNALALTGRTGAFDLWTIQFTALGGASGEAPIVFAAVNTLTNAAGQPLTHATDDGRLCVGAACSAPTAVPLVGVPAAQTAGTLWPLLFALALIAGVTVALLVGRARRAA